MILSAIASRSRCNPLAIIPQNTFYDDQINAVARICLCLPQFYTFTSDTIIH